MKIQENINELTSLLAVALACHEIDLKYKDFLFPKKDTEDGTLTIKLSNNYEKKIKSYITKFKDVLDDFIVITSLQTVLTKMENKYDDDWHTWTSEDMLFLLLHEFVRLFHAQEQYALPTNA